MWPLAPEPSAGAGEAHALARSLLKTFFMRHTKSRLAMELWCHAVDALLAQGASFADALDGANMILQAHKRQNEAADAKADGGREREQQGASPEAEGQLLSGMQRPRMG